MRKIILTPLCLSLLVFSCKKDTTPTNPNNNTPAVSTPPTPAPSTGDGFIVAINSVSTTNSPIGPIETSIGLGVAGFGNLSTSTFNDAGTVSINGAALTKQANNSYVFMPSASNPTGIDLSNDIKWSVNTPGFTYDAAKPNGKGIPTSAGFSTTPTSVTKTNDFTISLKALPGNTDSIYYQLASQNNKTVLKRMGANQTSVTFTSAEMADLTNGAAYLQAAMWNLETKTLGGKQIHVINELVYSLPVDIK